MKHELPHLSRAASKTKTKATTEGHEGKQNQNLTAEFAERAEGAGKPLWVKAYTEICEKKHDFKAPRSTKEHEGNLKTKAQRRGRKSREQNLI